MIKDIKVLLLAGGNSQRFWPLENKLLFPFLGKSLIDLQIEFLKAAGFEKIIVVLNNSFDKINTHNVQTIIQHGQGQAAAILSAKEFIKDEPILVLNADDIVSQNLFESLFYILNHDVNILVGYKLKNYFPGGYLKLDGKRVLKIIEKPGKGKEPSEYVRLVCDFYKNGQLLVDALKYVQAKDFDSKYEEGINYLINKGEIFEVLEYEDVWIPLKYPWQVFDITSYFLQKIQKYLKPKSTNIHKSAHLTGKIIFGENVRVLENAKITGPAYIGDNTIIGNNVLIRESMIGKNCVIGFSSDITRSYIGDNVWLHSNYIGDSVIFHNVSMGAGTILANLRLDERNIYSQIKKEKIETYKNKFGAIIGQNTHIGVNCNIMPGIKIGQNSYIGPGITLNKDLADNKRCFIKQEIVVKNNDLSLINSREEFRNKI